MGGKTQISASSAPKKTGKGSRKPKAKAKKERLEADYIGKGKSADEWVSNSGLAIISGWARNGLTFKEIAEKIGITDRTFRTWRKNYAEIEKVLQTNREMADLAVEGRLYSNALNGDNTAIIFYLKNRDPKKWKDHPVSADIELKKTELDLLKAENERKKLELEQKKLDYQMECLRYQISGAQGDEKTEAIKEFLEAVNPTNEQIDELYDEIESEEVSEDDACDGEENGS